MTIHFGACRPLPAPEHSSVRLAARVAINDNGRRSVLEAFRHGFASREALFLAGYSRAEIGAALQTREIARVPGLRGRGVWFCARG